MVSVIIPAYNAEEWIGETLASVAASEFPWDNLEIIVVDDGSTDSTKTIAQEFLEKGRSRWMILTQENGGPSKARNSGLRNARGEWIQFLDSDDLIHPAKMRLQVDVIKVTGTQVAAVYSPWCRYRKVAQKWVVNDLLTPDLDQDASVAVLQAQNFSHLGSQLFKKHWLEKVQGFGEDWRFIEDVELQLRILFAGGTFVSVSTNEPMFYYREHFKSLSNSSNLEFIRGCVRNAMFAENIWRSEHRAIDRNRFNTLLDVYAFALTYYYEHERAHFDSLLAHVTRLAPKFRPKHGKVKLISYFTGYERAEWLALAWRRLHRKFGLRAYPSRQMKVDSVA